MTFVKPVATTVTPSAAQRKMAAPATGKGKPVSWLT